MGFAVVVMAAGFALTRAQQTVGLSDGVILGLIGALIVFLLALADRIEGRTPPTGSVPRH